MSERSAYRDELEAAHARIARLEGVLAEQTDGDARARRIAALLRERAAVAEATEPPDVWPKLVWLFVVFWVVGIAFLIDHDWIFGTLALVSPFVMGLVAQRVLNANAAAALRQVELIDERLAELEKGA
jgi:hypothetical protein